MMDYATNFEKWFWEMIYHGTSPMIYHFSKSFLKIWLFMFCLHSLAMVGWPIHSRTADTATVLSISQPAPIHREYEKNISRKFIYILLILKCILIKREKWSLSFWIYFSKEFLTCILEKTIFNLKNNILFIWIAADVSLWHSDSPFHMY